MTRNFISNREMTAITWFMAVVCMCGCVSCNQREQAKGEIERIALTGTQLDMDEDYVGSRPLFIKNDTIGVATYSQEFNMQLCIVGDSAVRSAGLYFKTGVGPNEFNSTNIILGTNSNLIASNNGGWGALTEFYKIPLSQLAETDKWVRFPMENLVALRGATHFVEVNDSTILSTTLEYNKPYFLSLTNLNTQQLTPIEFWPEDSYDGPCIPKQAIYVDNTRLHKSGNKYLYVCGEAQYAFIFTLDGHKLSIVKELFTEKPEYECNDDKINYRLHRNGKDVRVAVTHDRIYALLRGLREDGQGLAKYNVPEEGNEVMVFDWNGEPISLLELDRKGTDLIVSADNSNLYLFSSSDELNGDGIRKYTLE